MKLIINNQPIALPQDTTISIEKVSPVLNENTGSYSYPFPVPTRPNQQILGWPGDLKRVGNIPGKSFILEDQGIQIIRGEVEFDTVTANEIGVILKSGVTAFNELVISSNIEENGASLSDLDWGQEEWFAGLPVTLNAWEQKLTDWDEWNRTADAPIIMAPFRLDDYPGNRHKDTGFLSNGLWDEEDGTYNFFMMQLRAWYLIEKIFESYGYTIIIDELNGSDYSDLIVFTRPFGVAKTAVDYEAFPYAGPNDKMIYPVIDNLVYANLMPEVKVLDFLEDMRVLLGLVYDIDDLDKEVKIILLTNVVVSDDEENELQELAGWQHKEPSNSSETGYSLSYMQQDDPLDIRADYSIGVTVDMVSNIPEPPSEGYVIHVTQTGRDYIAVKGENDTLFWSQIGRLKPCTSGKESSKVEFNVKIPQSLYTSQLYSGPILLLTTDGPHFGMVLYDMTEIYVSIYRGLITNTLITYIPFQFAPMPFLSADKWIAGVTPDLSPQGLYDSNYSAFIALKTSGAKEFTKYVKLTIPQLLALNWGSRYTISGVKVILSKINYDLPFTGIVKVDGFVA